MVFVPGFGVGEGVGEGGVDVEVDLFVDVAVFVAFDVEFFAAGVVFVGAGAFSDVELGRPVTVAPDAGAMAAGSAPPGVAKGAPGLGTFGARGAAAGVGLGGAAMSFPAGGESLGALGAPAQPARTTQVRITISHRTCIVGFSVAWGF